MNSPQCAKLPHAMHRNLSEDFILAPCLDNARKCFLRCQVHLPAAGSCVRGSYTGAALLVALWLREDLLQRRFLRTIIARDHYRYPHHSCSSHHTLPSAPCARANGNQQHSFCSRVPAVPCHIRSQSVATSVPRTERSSSHSRDYAFSAPPRTTGARSAPRTVVYMRRRHVLCTCYD